MLQKGYLDQIGVEFCQQVIDAIVNIKQETLRRSMGLFEGILGLWARVFDVIPKTQSPLKYVLTLS